MFINYWIKSKIETTIPEISREFSMLFNNKSKISPMIRNDKLPSIMNVALGSKVLNLIYLCYADMIFHQS